MARNRIQFQKGYSLVQFMDEYGTEDKCREALFRWRWPNGFVCPRCEHTGHCLVQSRWLYQCRGCRHQVSLTAGTIFASTKPPASHVVPGDVPDDADQERGLGTGAVAATFGELQHRLEGQAQADAGDEGARRHAPLGRVGAAR